MRALSRTRTGASTPPISSASSARSPTRRRRCANCEGSSSRAGVSSSARSSSIPTSSGSARSARGRKPPSSASTGGSAAASPISPGSARAERPLRRAGRRRRRVLRDELRVDLEARRAAVLEAVLPRARLHGHVDRRRIGGELVAERALAVHLEELPGLHEDLPDHARLALVPVAAVVAGLADVAPAVLAG